MLTHGSLFTGIGGIDLGFERAGIETAWQVELDDYATRVLEKHWPDVERHRDVTKVGKHNLAEVDIISGGFPCQDLSVAGKQRGLHAGRSGLWWEMLRVACELRPRILVVENVPNLLSGDGGNWARVFFGSLAESGFDCEWGIVSAKDAGAPHLRKRAFVVAYAESARCGQQVDVSQQPGRAATVGPSEDSTVGGTAADGRAEAGGEDVADASEPEQQGDKGRVLREQGGPAAEAGGEDIRQQNRETGAVVSRPMHESGDDVADADEVGRDGRAGELGSRRRGEFENNGVGGGGASNWAVEPNVGRVAHGVPARVDRLRCLGNAVVPQVAEWLGRRIVEALR